jgi:hypothetical protein
VEETNLVANSPEYAQAAPQERTFAVTTAGRYRVTLTDVKFPTPLTSANLVITKGTVQTARLSAAGFVDFDATVGTYSVRVLGSGSSAGTLGVTIAPTTGGAALLDFTAGIAAALTTASSAQTTFNASFTPNVAGNYQIEVIDRTLPAALQSYDLLIVDNAGTPVGRICLPAIANVCSPSAVNLAATTVRYDLFLVSQAAAPQNAGLLSLRVTQLSSSNVIYGATQPIGLLQKLADVQLPAAAPYTVRLTDLQFPAAFAQLRAVVMQDAELLANVSASGTSALTANQGVATVYLYGTIGGAANAGVARIEILRGTESIWIDTRAVLPLTQTSVRAYAFTTSIPTTGRYRVQIKDFAFPSTLTSLLTQVSQNGSVDVQADVGNVSVVVIADTLSSTTLGLFGVSIDAIPASATHIYESTQGVGDLFASRPLNIGTAGSFDVSLNDLAFPAAFGDLALAVTRGTTLVGQIFGGGKFSFNATPGAYSLNFIARTGTGAKYGLYGTKVEDSPPPPAVTLTATPTTVASGGSTSVTWTSSGATSCVASGGWNGTKTVSGSTSSIGPLSADTTLTLTCTGPGGSTAVDQKIVIASETAKSGGGAFDMFALSLAIFLLVVRVARPRVRVSVIEG